MPDPHPPMLLGAQCMTYGSSDAAWRWPTADPRMWLDLDALAHTAQEAERGGFAFVFIADHAALREDLTTQSPTATIDPIVLVSQLVSHTERIGFVLTQSTTFNLPYTVARQLKALDVLSAGRIGWNAVTTNDPAIAANYGQRVQDRPVRYARAHEFVDLVQALWGSWPEHALRLDARAGVWADAGDLVPVNLSGEYVTSRGPLPVPASPQGQPILVQAGGGEEGLALAGRYASGVYSMATDVGSGRAHRAALDEAARAFGRDPSDIKLFMGISTSLGEDREAALARRRALLELSPRELPLLLRHLSALVGVGLDLADLHRPLTPARLAAVRPAPHQLHAERACRLLADGLSPYDVLASGVTEFHTVALGSPDDVADELQALFEAGACDGFVIVPDVVADGLPAFVDQVVPVLRRRGLLAREDPGATNPARAARRTARVRPSTTPRLRPAHHPPISQNRTVPCSPTPPSPPSTWPP